MSVNKTPYYLENPPTEVSASRTSPYIDNIQLPNTPLDEYPPINMVTEKLAHTKRYGKKQFLLPIKTVGSEEFSVGIVIPFRIHRACRNDLTIQTTIIKFNQSNGWIHSDYE